MMLKNVVYINRLKKKAEEGMILDAKWYVFNILVINGKSIRLDKIGKVGSF